MASAQVTQAPTGGAFGSPGFGATFHSEWTKMRSIRSAKILVGLAIVLSVGMTGLMSLVIGSTWEEWAPQQQAAFHPVIFSFFGIIFGAVLVSVLAVTMVTNEYSSGMMRLTLTATPRRGRVLAAKLLLIAIVSLIVGTISTFGMFFAGQAGFGAYGVETASLSESDALRAVLGVSLMSPVYPIVAVALAVLLRSTAGAVTAILALIFAPDMFGGLLPVWLQENVLAFVLGPVTDSISIQHIADGSAMFLDLPVAIVALAAWLVIPTGVAYLAFKRRDA